jgi:hypothetical protein
MVIKQISLDLRFKSQISLKLNASDPMVYPEIFKKGAKKRVPNCKFIPT